MRAQSSDLHSYQYVDEELWNTAEGPFFMLNTETVGWIGFYTINHDGPVNSL